MLPKVHIVIGALLSILIFLFFPSVSSLNAFLIFLASVLIDFDHYAYYAYHKKDWSLKRAYSWFVDKRAQFMNLKPQERKKYRRVIMLFHGIEFWIILILLVKWSIVFLFILLGIIIHITLDLIELYALNEPLPSKLSQVYVFIKNKKRKNLG